MMYSKDIIERYRKAAVASICDACDAIVKKRCFMDHDMRPRVTGRKIVGPAATVLEEPSDAGLPPTHLFDVIDNAEGGEVLVISLKSDEPNISLLGGLMTAGAVANGFEAAVLNRGVRDLPEIQRDFRGFEIFSATVSPVQMAGRYVTIAGNVPVECGGITVNPGDMIIGDMDGVVCVPKEYVEEVLKLAEEIEVKEAAQSTHIKQTGSLQEGMQKYNLF